MIPIPLYRYTTHTSRGDLEVPTFRDTPQTTRVGTLLAPDGTTLRPGTPGQPPKLKVPKSGRPGEFDLLCAAEAIAAAASGRYGLALDREAQGVERA